MTIVSPPPHTASAGGVGTTCTGAASTKLKESIRRMAATILYRILVVVLRASELDDLIKFLCGQGERSTFSCQIGKGRHNSKTNRNGLKIGKIIN
jgi:hypothetical protein